ncbi:hypothetical protein RFI_30455 [Reticulomyxa filosa]|uniref:isopentenyl-diphosphate Delta-isomerase n=1 Tax=Reticulomyxa filosa TaxID=46433 RepID=X6LZB3_RETFI|nr:hypothetical protein RFI_30455 [Reticulomyxa filosa]|eukprot:ETO06939.1 hypothetical protein RFI_30455 [Reticulomyxa filosa]
MVTKFSKHFSLPYRSYFLNSLPRRLLTSQPKYDALQIQAMEEDKCVLVDTNDNIIGSATKKQCHSREKVSKNEMLHRAFSVLLFDEQNRLLLQKRSAHKITFPNCWTNTCCSHPLYQSSHCELTEMSKLAKHRQQQQQTNNDEWISLQYKVDGTKRAAIDRMAIELGISPGQIHSSQLHFLTRVLYKAILDEHWAEFESYVCLFVFSCQIALFTLFFSLFLMIECALDYILIARKRVNFNANPNEVSDIRYFDKVELKELMRQAKVQTDVKSQASSAQQNTYLVSPWFKILYDHFLEDWWLKLDDIIAGKVPADPRVHNFVSI